MGIGQLAFPAQANGSLVSAEDQVVGSSVLGQALADPQGNPLPQRSLPEDTPGGALTMVVTLQLSAPDHGPLEVASEEIPA